MAAAALRRAFSSGVAADIVVLTRFDLEFARPLLDDLSGTVWGTSLERTGSLREHLLFAWPTADDIPTVDALHDHLRDESLAGHGVGDGGKCSLPAIARRAPFLCALCLGGAGATVRDTDLAALASHCPLLAALDLSGCFNVGNDGIRALAAGCHRIARRQ